MNHFSNLLFSTILQLKLFIYFSYWNENLHFLLDYLLLVVYLWLISAPDAKANDGLYAAYQNEIKGAGRYTFRVSIFTTLTMLKYVCMYLFLTSIQ